MKKNYVLCLILFFIIPISFSENITTIPEVKISPKQTAQNNYLPPAQIVHYTRKKISSSAETTLSGLLQEQSMLRLVNNSSDTGQVAFSLRGFGDNAVANSLILVDGFPLINPSLLAPDFNAILLSDIERLDILQGSQGTFSGNQAVGGVVNVITHHPEKFFGNITTALGSYNVRSLSAIVGDKFSNGIFFKLSGFGNETDNYRAHNQQTNDGFSSQIGFDYDRGFLTLNQKMYTRSTFFPGGLTEEQFNTNPTQATDYKNHTTHTTQIYQLLSKHAFNNHWLLETRMAHNDTRSDGFSFVLFNSDQWSNSINPQLVGSIFKNKITLGYSWQNSGYENINTKVTSRAKSQQHDIYAQLVAPLSDFFDLTVGGRSAWQENAPEIIIDQPIHYTDHVFVTEQGLAFHPTSTWTFFVRRDGNFRFPKTNEQVWLPIDITTLKPQTGVSYETGAQRQTLNQKTQLSFYHLVLKNELAFNPTQTVMQPFGAINNLDETSRDGFSLTEQYHLTPEVELDGQLNYVNARFSDGNYVGNQIPAVPTWTANAGIGYKFLPHWKASYNALYTGSAYAAQDVGNTAKKNPSYWLSKVALQYFFKQLNLSFEINNLFNQHYAAYVSYDTFTQENSYYPGAGRNFLLTAKMNLG